MNLKTDKSCTSFSSVFNASCWLTQLKTRSGGTFLSFLSGMTFKNAAPLENTILTEEERRGEKKILL